MEENYRGYYINTRWNHKTMGFDFFVRSEVGAEVFCNEKPYFYEENALAAAKVAIDGKLSIN